MHTDRRLISHPKRFNDVVMQKSQNLPYGLKSSLEYIIEWFSLPNRRRAMRNAILERGLPISLRELRILCWRGSRDTGS